jgi:GNAT superfamily N-acetyltransferase
MVRAATILVVTVLAVRPARADEAETLFAIQRESALAAYEHVFPPERYPFPEEEMRVHWREVLRDDARETLIAECDGRRVGMVIITPGWLESLFVVPDQWGGGAGAALHDEAVVRLRAHGAGARLWVLEANERARRFYERRGWRHDGERRQSEFPPYPPALRYVLDLESAAIGVGRKRGPAYPSLTPTHPGD